MENEDVKVAILETRLENFETLVSRLDSAIEKIAEVNNNVSRVINCATCLNHGIKQWMISR